MDLLFIQNVIILHVMCMFTHLSSSTVVRSKVSTEVGKAFVNSWVNYYGVPRRILSGASLAVTISGIWVMFLEPAWMSLEEALTGRSD